MAMKGWAGKILRLNMTNLTSSTEDTANHTDYLGGMGFGYEIIYKEVPVGTTSYEPASKIVFAAGPLSGTGAPCSDRTNITLISPLLEKPLIVDAHMGGNFSSQMKYAGYDAIIVEGQSEKPVWVKIADDKVTFESAETIWGNGIRKTTEMINAAAGNDFCVCAIGQAGENLVNMSVVANSLSHIGGAGAGAVFGSKKLKAIAIYGTHSIQVADPKKLMELYEYQMKELIGTNNNHVVPKYPQSWAEFTANTRWTGGPGRTWGAAKGGPLDTGEQEPGNMNAVGYRTILSTMYLGDASMKYVVKQSGCQSCPVRCYPEFHMEEMAQYGLPVDHSQVCGGFMHHDFYQEGMKDFKDEGDAKTYIAYAASCAMDDFGVWCNYAAIDTDFKWCYKHKIFEKVLPKEEYESLHWDWMKDGDPRWVQDVMRRVAMKEGEFSRLGEGSYRLAKAWNLGDEYWNDAPNKMFLQLGFPKHHANESAGQVGSLINILFNRDPMCHTHTNIIGSGLPIDLQKSILAETFGSPDCIDPPNHWTPMNQYKAKFAKWSIVRNNVHDMLTLCNWVWPMTFSPVKARGYKGDLTLEAQIISAVTGEEFTEASLDAYGEKVLHLHRALTALEMGSKNLRLDHDKLGTWVFDMDPDVPAFGEGTYKLDRADWEVALDMFFDELGWDKTTGIPTRATLEKFDLAYAADDLEKAGLLPA